MTSKHSRHAQSPSSPGSAQPSKFSKFLQRPSSRDRNRSATDQAAQEPPPLKPVRKTSRFLASKDKDDRNSSSSARSDPPQSDSVDEPPVIIEPRPRTRSERPLSSASDVTPSISLYSSTSSNRLSDLPTRLSGWFSHTFSSSTADLSLPNLLSQSAHSSPRSKGSALLAAAKTGKGHLDKAVRYLLDTDSTPDKCPQPIWLLGVQHPGHEPSSPISPTARRSTTDIRKLGSTASFHSSPSSPPDQSLLLSQSQPAPQKQHPSNNWPTLFYADFTSRIWLTYRSQFQPIRDTSLVSLDSDSGDNAQPVSSSPILKRWNWGGEKNWSSDQGWGCMLRTGQSLLANALLHLHLGRDWRRPPHPVFTVDYAMYIQILTWFLDSPSPLAPFSVHRMALAGKELGKDVGQWFGPSTAAGAIKRLVRAFPEAGVGVAVASDSAIFQSDVYAASHGTDTSPGRQITWGGRAVLILIGVRLGLEGVNPIYYDTIKTLYSFPQSVGIAGGRPSSSYYFVGSQADNLFYLDPHHTRPTVPLRPPPLYPRDTPSDSDREKDKDKDALPSTTHHHRRSSPSNHHRPAGTYSPSSSSRTGSSSLSHHGPISPSPLQHQLSTSPASASGSTSASSSSSRHHLSSSRPIPISPRRVVSVGGGGVTSPSPIVSSSDAEHREFGVSSGVSAGLGLGLDGAQEHYIRAYAPVELKTFHCERVRKMPLSGLDPSMLIGFLCKDEEDWVDFKHRVAELSRKHKTIFSVQDEPPTWPSDSDDNMGLESLSEPDELDMDMDMDEEDDDGVDEPEHDEVEPDEEVDVDPEGERFFDTRSQSASTSSGRDADHDADDREHGRNASRSDDTEEDPVDPITPGPGARMFSEQQQQLQLQSLVGGGDLAGVGEKGVVGLGEDVDDDDWVDPSVSPVSSPVSRGVLQHQHQHQHQRSPPGSIDMPTLAKGKLKKGSKKSSSKRSAPGGAPVLKTPVPPRERSQEHFPFPVTPKSAEDHESVGGVGSYAYERPHVSSVVKAPSKRMHTTKARDGGRTQSGGVKGVLPTADDS